MTIEDIQRLIAGDETRTLELKKTTGELKDAMQTACAFLNTDGGWLIFGVAPTSLNIIGQQVSEATRREIAHELAKIEPAVDLKVEYVDIPEKEGFQVIAMHFDSWPRGTAPFTFDSRPYYRLESITKIMPREMFESRIRDSKPQLFAWERQTADGLTIEDLDDTRIMETVRGGVRGGRLAPSALNETKEQILSKLKLQRNGKINNAAVALFTKETYGYPQLLLRMARFKGSGKNEFGDNQAAHGNFFTLLDAGMSFLFKHLNLSGKIVGLQREEQLEIPAVALREALTNALCHRAFDQPSDSVSIAIYDDRVEIGNPGNFPHNLTPVSIKQNHESFPQNPLIASVLYQTNYLERWGSGVQRMISACERQDLEEPSFDERNGFVHIVFKRPIHNPTLHHVIDYDPNPSSADPNRDPNLETVDPNPSGADPNRDPNLETVDPNPSGADPNRDPNQETIDPNPSSTDPNRDPNQETVDHNPSSADPNRDPNQETVDPNPSGADPNRDPNQETIDPNQLDTGETWIHATKHLTEKQKQIVEAISKNKSQTLPSLARTLSMSLSSLKREIKDINNHITLKWEGTTRTGIWVISPNAQPK